MADKRPEELIDYWPKDVGLDDFRQGYLVGKHDGFKAGYEEGMISGFNGVIGRENLMLRGHAPPTTIVPLSVSACDALRFELSAPPVNQYADTRVSVRAPKVPRLPSAGLFLVAGGINGFAVAIFHVCQV